MDFATGTDVRSVADLVEGERRVVVLRTFSKLHGMAGMRMGYAVTHPELVKRLETGAHDDAQHPGGARRARQPR